MIKRALPLLAIVAACEAPPGAPATEPGTESAAEPVAQEPGPEASADPIFFGVGQEPGWIVRIYDDRIAYEGDYGETLITVDNPGAESIENGRRYVTEELTVEITEQPCADAMSGAPYPETVRITEGERSWRGCGGPRPSQPVEQPAG